LNLTLVFVIVGLDPTIHVISDRLKVRKRTKNGDNIPFTFFLSISYNNLTF